MLLPRVMFHFWSNIFKESLFKIKKGVIDILIEGSKHNIGIWR
jgi:hypothetical protein